LSQKNIKAFSFIEKKYVQDMSSTAWRGQNKETLSEEICKRVGKLTASAYIIKSL